MICPRCQVKLASTAASCEACHFDLIMAKAALGSDLVKLDRLTDRAHCLRLKETQQLESALDEFGRNFPQVFVAVYCGVLPQTIAMSELTFWLLNHGAFGTQDFRRLNEFAIVLVLDPVAKNAGLNVGYSLEQCLPQKFLLKTLKSMRTALWHGEYASAITTALNCMARKIRKHGKKMKPVVDVVPPGSAEEFLEASGLQRLRRGKERKRETSILDEGDMEDSF